MRLLKTPEQAAASIAFAALAPPSLFATKQDAPAPAPAPCCGTGPSAGAGSGTACSSGACGIAPEAGTASDEPTMQGEPAVAGTSGGSCCAPPAPAGPQAPGYLIKGLSVSGRYIEDCRLSQPSPEARDIRAELALWQVGPGCWQGGDMMMRLHVGVCVECQRLAQCWVL
jgi:hypothetical protein